MKRVSLGLAAVIVVLGLTAVSAQKPTTPSTIVLNPPPEGQLDSWPALGDWVGFTASFAKQLESKNIRVQVLCYQGGELVYGMAGSHDTPMQLGGGMSQWYLNGGPASCVADLYYWSYNRGQRFNWLASTNFEAFGR
jgi:hypothetical protein